MGKCSSKQVQVHPDPIIAIFKDIAFEMLDRYPKLNAFYPDRDKLAARFDAHPLETQKELSQAMQIIAYDDLLERSLIGIKSVAT